MKNIIIAIGLLFSLACGGAENLDDQDETEVGTLEQALTIPGGGAYTFLKSNVHARCSTGGVCLAPRDRKVRFKSGTVANTPDGFKNLFDTAFSRAVTDMCARLNARGWDCASTTGSSNEVVNVINASGPIGAFTAGNIEGTVLTVSGDARSWQRFNSCSMTINRTAFFADPSYAGMSSQNRDSALNSLILHQLGHCVGLSQNTQGVMSVQTLGQAIQQLQNPSFSLQELNDLLDYRP